MKLGELLKSAGLPLPVCERMCAREIVGISSDSRTVRRGELFVALCGLRVDATVYVAEALAKGAAFVIAQRPLDGRNTMLVKDARAALAALLDAWYGHPAADMSLIGITGTNGKTSTATMLFHILREAGHHAGLIGTVECRMDDERLTAQNPWRLANMTTPDVEQLYALLYEMKQRGASYVVMEVTSHALFFKKVAPLHFSRAVFTNLSPDHLDLHGDMESYFMEKRALFTKCDEAIISCNGAYGRRLLDSLECPAREISPRTVREVISHGVDGVSFSLCEAGRELPLTLPVPGEFSVENAALAASCARSLGVADAVIKGALAGFGGARGRMERVLTSPLGFSVFLDYAHTPDALEKLLRTVRGFALPEERIVLMFGCGGDRDRTKRKEMGRIGSALADLVVITSDNCRGEDPDAIIADILRGVDKEKPYKVIKDRDEAIRYCIDEAKKGDIILLVGKGHEEYEIRGHERLPFSERRIVREKHEERIMGEQREDLTTD